MELHSRGANGGAEATEVVHHRDNGDNGETRGESDFDLKLAEWTVVMFLTDNGPRQPRYNAGMLRLKGTVNEGSIRVPIFVRWRGRFEPGRNVDRIAAHIDVTPTLLDLCQIAKPRRVRYDGVSLRPLLAGREIGTAKSEQDVAAGATTVSFEGVRLGRGAGTLASDITEGNRRIGMLDVVSRGAR